MGKVTVDQILAEAKTLSRDEQQQLRDTLNRSTRDWYTQAATFACSLAAMFSTAAVTAGSS